MTSDSRVQLSITFVVLLFFILFASRVSRDFFVLGRVCSSSAGVFKTRSKNDEWVVMRLGLNDNDKSHICAFALDWLRVFHPLARRRTCWNFFFLSPSFALLADGALVCVAF